MTAQPEAHPTCESRLLQQIQPHNRNKNMTHFTNPHGKRTCFTKTNRQAGIASPTSYTVPMNINKTDHFLLAATREEPKRSASTLELAGLTMAAVAVIALSSLLI